MNEKKTEQENQEEDTNCSCGKPGYEFVPTLKDPEQGYWLCYDCYDQNIPF